MNNIFKKLILSLISIFFIFLSLYICEFYLNYIHYESNNINSGIFHLENTQLLRIDNRLIYAINGDNRYQNRLKPKDSTKTNVAFVGDSVTWSFGANDNNTTYPKTFENLYNSSSNKKILVNNFGTPGYNLDQEYLLIKEKILRSYQPDVVIWNLNANDIWESNYSCLFTPKDHQWSRISARHNIYYWYGFMKKYLPKPIFNSRLFDLSWSHFTQVFTNKNDYYTFGCSSINFNDQTRQLILNKLNFFINDLKNDFQKRNIKLIITLVPYQQYLDKQTTPRQVSSEFLALKEYLTTNNSINFIDFNEIIPKTKNNTNPAEEYFLSSTIDSAEKGWRHPNQKMYDLMANTLKNYVQKNKFF